MARIITITSGKGGVGKTSISLNLSLSLAAEGFKVCLFDADLGLANVNILTGIYPEKDLEAVMDGQLGLTEIMIKNYQGIDIIPGSSGVGKMADLTQTQTRTLIRSFLDLDDYDYFIFDTSAGISSQVLSFCMASHEIILVATCEPTSLTDAYAMLKALSKFEYKSPVKVLINQVRSGKAAQKAYAQLKDTVNKFLSIRVEPLGIMVSDKNVRAAVISQTPFFLLFPDTIATRCIRTIREKLTRHAGSTGDIPLEIFWDHCLSFLQKHHPPKKELGTSRSDGQAAAQTSLDTKEALARLESKLSLVIEEVGQIRQFLEKAPIPHKSREKMPVLPDPVEISLDFESWFKKK